MPSEKSSSDPRPAPPAAVQSTEEPPAYSAPESSRWRDAPQRSQVPNVPGMTTLPLDRYTPPSSTLSSDRTILTVVDPTLTNTPAALVSFLHAQAALPPYLTLRISGNSSGRPDFDLKINLLRYLVGQEEGLNYVKLDRTRVPDDVRKPLSKGEPNLLTIARAFCADRSTNKTFTLHRTIPNLDASILQARVSQLANELKYKGEFKVAFPITYQKIIIAPDTSIADKFIGLFSKPRDYAVMEAVWPFATSPPPAPGEHETANTVRTFAVRSEEGLWHDWKPAVERAMLEGRNGWVGLDDLIEARMGLPGPTRRVGEWGWSTAV